MSYRIADQYERTIECIDEDVDQIETQVFGGDDSSHVERIYELEREISQFRRAVAPLAAPLERLGVAAVPGVDTVTVPYFRDVHDHVQRVADAIESHDRLLIDVLQADLAITGIRQSEIGVRQNEDMRKISAWAAIALVPIALAGIYGMNFDYMPELSWRYGYFIVLMVMATICMLLHRLFRRNDWP